MSFFSERKKVKDEIIAKKRNDVIEYYRKLYYSAIESVQVPANAIKLQHSGANCEYLVWKEKENIYVLRELENQISRFNSYIIEIDENIERYKRNAESWEWLITIPLVDIKWFEYDGQIEKETVITGGGGGGSSIGRALVSSLIAGEVGASAIIASRKEIEPIRSETITYDNRATYLEYTINLPDGSKKDKCLSFKPSAYEVFMDLIPEKEYSYVMSQKLPKAPAPPAQGEQTAKERLEQLQELKETGLITEEEYNQKRQEILSSL